MPTPSDILRILSDRGTCSAEDLSMALGCPVGDVLQMVHSLWWEAEQIAGPSGWLYRLRPCVSEMAWACRVQGSSKVW